MRRPRVLRQTGDAVHPEPPPSTGGRTRRGLTSRDDTEAVPVGVRVAAAWSWRFLAIVAAVAVAAVVIVRIRLLVFPLAVALLLASALSPGVAALRRRGWPRALAAATVFLAFLGVITGSLTLAGGQLGQQFDEVWASTQDGLVEIRRWLTTGPLNLDDRQLDEFGDRAREAVIENQGGLTTGAISTATMAVEFVTGLVLTLFALFFFLYDGDRIWQWVVRLFPRAARRHTDEAGRRAYVTLSAFVRGTLLIALFDATLITVLLLILRVPLAVPLGVLVFFGAFVPLVGAFVTGAVAVLVAFVTQGFFVALLVLAGIVAIQQLEGQIFQPLVLGRMVRIHPLAVVAAITAGALVGGIAGAVVAVPIAAVLNTVVLYLTGEGRDLPPAPERRPRLRVRRR